MPLSELTVRKAKPAAKPYKLTDEGGLFLLVSTTGSKLWRFKYRHLGKEKLLSLPVHPHMASTNVREHHQCRFKAARIRPKLTGELYMLGPLHCQLTPMLTRSTISPGWVFQRSRKE
ncbi:Arm DNA-binding domain-containing protein [Asticcacaulis sp. ZE23SCel15]|uniref:Arm DNA-binding domain-containing protein n=1 Tax=Asticcacaulis sp. ZE23SCel15 TaxID=3059027 RepID=UPI00265FAFC7|nr:Arm DNA-binding domain-containing protein [Asticcacaulis sp. ZE23SCel15]WKL57379.1 Arm DNA-binding domain-containing protein [Asticcacaulis sp. ZE23SCel15]